MLTARKFYSSLFLLGCVAVVGCSSATSGGSTPNPRALPEEGSSPPDVSQLYRQIGLLAAPAPVSFVGRIADFASASPDTTLVLASISIPNHALTFSREGDK
ncbi:MAG: hypothetical protein ACREMY_34165, partial [bacterium]